VSISIGVCLLVAVNLVKNSAIIEFNRASNIFYGKAELSIEGRFQYFDEVVFDELLRNKSILSISEISPEIIVKSSTKGKKAVEILGIDFFRAAKVTPIFFRELEFLSLKKGQSNFRLLSILEDGNVILTQGLADDSSQIELLTTDGTIELNALATLPPSISKNLILMDLANIQKYFKMEGKLSRLNLKLSPGANIDRIKEKIMRTLSKKGLEVQVQIIDELDREKKLSTISRAYSSNLFMLSLITILASFFLVFSVVENSFRKQINYFVLLKVLGLNKKRLYCLAMMEVLVFSSIGSTVGVLAGVILAEIMFSFFMNSFSATLFSQYGNNFNLDLILLLGSWLLGVMSSLLAALVVLAGLRDDLKVKLQQSDNLTNLKKNNYIFFFSVMCFTLAILLISLPSFNGVPFFSYTGIALILISLVLMIPWASATFFRTIFNATYRKAQEVSWVYFAFMRLINGSVFSVNIIASVVVSFALTVSILIMVMSFRESLQTWLDKIIVADIYATPKVNSYNHYIDSDSRNFLEELKGIESIDFSKNILVSFGPDKLNVSLLIRSFRHEERNDVVPLIGTSLVFDSLNEISFSERSRGKVIIYVSESFALRYDYKLFDDLYFSMGPNTLVNAVVGGIYRDYSRQYGSLMMTKKDYLSLGGSKLMTQFSLWLNDKSEVEVMKKFLENQVLFSNYNFINAREIKDLSLKIFDRTFTLTYFLAFISCLISVFSIVCSYSSQSYMRRKEISLMIQLGESKKFVCRQISFESFLLSSFSVFYGSLIGVLISLVLVFKINPQSFYWTMDLNFPVVIITCFGLCLVALGSYSAFLTIQSTINNQNIKNNLKEEW
tara:strand:+ start:5465 stop:7984 length:2520 start_codon:yes stop_codon:yes gene_type:complete